jgi:DinB superfamily
MKKLVLCLSLVLMMCAVAIAQDAAAAPKAKAKKAAAAAAKPANAMKMDVTSVLERNLKNLENDVVPAADAMPEDKYSFKPTNDLIKGSEFTGVKTYADQVKHIAVTNELITACLNGQPQPVPDAESDLGPAKLTSKADIMQYLKDSFAHAHEAFAKINKANIDGQVRNPFGKGTRPRLGLTIVILGHTQDHYGQMVEYLRMNGIIPPASRPPAK